MPNFKITPKDSTFLTIEIGEKNYNIPLAKSMKNKEIRSIMECLKLPQTDQYGFICDFLGKYLGNDLVDDLLMEDTFEIFYLWINANNTVGGLSLGESSASSNS